MAGIGTRIAVAVPKNFDQHLNAIKCIASCTPLPIFVPVPGSGEQNRIGNHVVMTHVDIKGAIVVDPAFTALGEAQTTLAGTTYSVTHPIRIAVVYDRQNNQAMAPPLPLAIWDYQSISTQLPYAFRNKEFMDRYVIIYDKTFKWSYPINSNGDSIVPVKISRKVSLPVDFSGATGGYSDITTGNLWVYAMSDTNVTSAAGNAPVFQFEARTSFRDV